MHAVLGLPLTHSLHAAHVQRGLRTQQAMHILHAARGLHAMHAEQVSTPSMKGPQCSHAKSHSATRRVA